MLQVWIMVALLLLARSAAARINRWRRAAVAAAHLSSPFTSWSGRTVHSFAYSEGYVKQFLDRTIAFGFALPERTTQTSNSDGGGRPVLTGSRAIDRLGGSKVFTRAKRFSPKN